MSGSGKAKMGKLVFEHLPAHTLKTLAKCMHKSHTLYVHTTHIRLNRTNSTIQPPRDVRWIILIQNSIKRRKKIVHQLYMSRCKRNTPIFKSVMILVAKKIVNACRIY